MLNIRNLEVKYGGFFAIRSLDLEIKKGERLGILGQSGSGKTTLCKVIAGVEKSYKGDILWDSLNRKIQFIFQDPVSSLNPRMKIFDIVTEPLIISGIKDKEIIKSLFENAMIEVGLSPDIAINYPHQLSGGQRQRVSIARALIIEPDLLLCDEPISSLDISLAAQVLNLIDELQKKHGFALIFVSHDISSVYYLTEKTIILLKGQVVEEGPTEEIIEKPLHPYTQLLISSILSIGKKHNFNISEKAGISDSQCPFSFRCHYACDKCRDYKDLFYNYNDNHKVKCVRFMEIFNEKISC